GKSSDSPLIQFVSGAKEDKVMPPKGERLTMQQVAKLRQWIDEGAPWPDGETALAVKSDHWAFQRIQLPEVPKGMKHPVDAFVRARLAKEGLKPSEPADRATLIRRLSLDLLGLPPSIDEVDRFVNDKSSDAYEKLVDRLLASKHFGERWGRHWLDLARYADSDGYEKDRARPFAYVFRDWVIKAVNDDQPLDQFSTEQLAGDLLPNATLAQKEATGFHRQTLTNTEGGTDKEEFRCKAVVDRVSTTATVWLGITMGCAECHSHKYDPITQREFYQFFAFFNDASEKNIASPRENELKAYNSATAKWKAETGKRTAAYSKWKLEQLPELFEKWAASTSGPSTEWKQLKPTKLHSKSGATLKQEEDNVVYSTGKNPGTDTYTIETATDLKKIAGVRLEAIDDPSPKLGPGRSRDGNFVLTKFSLEAKLPNGKTQKLTLQHPKANFSQSKFNVTSSVKGLKTTGWAVSPKKNENHVAVYEVKEKVELPKGTKLTFRLEHYYKTTYLLQRFRLSVTDSAGPFLPSLVGDEIATLLAKSERNANDNKKLLTFYQENVDTEAVKLRKAISDEEAKKPKYPPTTAAVIVAQPNGRKTQIHRRGNFMDKGDEVFPLTPAVLHPLKARGKKPDRLDLANWLFEKENPLTARVMVNHIWKNLFGRGIVGTIDDFGTRGDKPSHPQLLDWLATELPRLGWSRKQFIKRVVMSETYRQSSRMRPELLEQDPRNYLLARQSRMRLEAEVVRDSYLLASGLLSRKIGGPSIRPPLPADIAALGYAGSVRWKASTGADKYRRGLYIFFQRSVPYPMLKTFDAPESTATCVRRERSNTPLQALTLLNDPVFHECAQALGRRMDADVKGEDHRAKLAHGFKLCMSREPEDPELDRLEKLYDRQLKLATADSKGSAQTIGAKESEPNLARKATLVALSRVMLNLDEFITRE
ncbi:MAG: DUF1549 and DUF1553 domain-containing protein, partial [Limisphaerales bacterium]